MQWIRNSRQPGHASNITDQKTPDADGPSRCGRGPGAPSARKRVAPRTECSGSVLLLAATISRASLRKMASTTPRNDPRAAMPARSTVAQRLRPTPYFSIAPRSSARRKRAVAAHSTRKPVGGGPHSVAVHTLRIRLYLLCTTRSPPCRPIATITECAHD